MIKTIFSFFENCQKKKKTDFIKNLLKTKYETYKTEFSQKMKNLVDEDLNQKIKILLLKIKNINKIFFGDEKNREDFFLIKKILEKYVTEKYKFEAYNIIKICLLIEYQNFQFYYTKLFKEKNFSKNFEKNFSEFEKKKNLVIENFNIFLEFKMSKFDMNSNEQNLIRIEAFNLLLNIYSMISSNKISHIFFLYFKPKEEILKKLLKFVNLIFEKNHKILILDSNKKKLIQQKIDNSFENSQNFENSFENLVEISENGEKSKIMENSKNLENFENTKFFFQNEMSQFVASKMTDFLIKCSQSNFGRFCIHKIINLFFFEKSKFSNNNIKSILYSFLKKILEQDFENLEFMNFWGSFYKIILLLNDNEKKCYEISRFYLKIFDSSFKKKKINEIGKKKIFDGFLRMIIILYKEAVINNKKFFFKLLKKIFIKKNRFVNEEEKLKILFYKLSSDYKNEIEKLETVDIEEIEALHGKIARFLDFNKKIEKIEKNENFYIGNLNEKKNVEKIDENEIEDENLNLNKNNDKRKNKKKGKKKFEEKFDDDRIVRNMKIKKKNFVTE